MVQLQGRPDARRVLRSLGTEDRDLLGYYLDLPSKARMADFWCTCEAARRTGLTQRTIQGWIQSGKIVALRIGKKYFVLRASLEEYLAETERGD